jgi:heme/copper-type cytochrome/quinol oxidase subunit 2
MIFTTLAVLALFAQVIITARAEPVSENSGTNLLVTLVMVLILIILASFSTLTTSIDGEYLRVKFGFGLFKKKFPLKEIATVTSVKNHWYYGYGIRFWLWPKMWIYNVSGFDAVELTMKNGKIYRIGTDAPKELESAIKFSLFKV